MTTKKNFKRWTKNCFRIFSNLSKSLKKRVLNTNILVIECELAKNIKVFDTNHS